MEDKLFEIKNLCIQYSSEPLLNDFSLELKKSERLGIYSPNGSGKSTLLNYLAGILDPKYIKSGEIKYFSECKASYAFQDFRLLENLTVMNNLLLVIKNLLNKDELEKVALQMLKDVQLEQKLNQKVKNLSGGEKQRLSLIRSLLYPSNLVLLDEPFNALSESVKQNVMDFTKENLIKTGRSCILVSHQKSELEFLCTRIIQLKCI